MERMTPEQQIAYWMAKHRIAYKHAVQCRTDMKFYGHVGSAGIRRDWKRAQFDQREAFQHIEYWRGRLDTEPGPIT